MPHDTTAAKAETLEKEMQIYFSLSLSLSIQIDMSSSPPLHTSFVVIISTGASADEMPTHASLQMSTIAAGYIE